MLFIIVILLFYQEKNGTIEQLDFNELEKLRAQDCIWQLLVKNIKYLIRFKMLAKSCIKIFRLQPEDHEKYEQRND